MVTVLVDLTPLVDGHGPAPLIDMRAGRSAEVLRTWLNDRDPGFREHLEVVTMDGFAAYGHPDRSRGRKLMAGLMDTLRKGLPKGLEDLAQFGRTLWRRRAEILAHFDLGASNGPVEAVSGRLEHLRGTLHWGSEI